MFKNKIKELIYLNQLNLEAIEGYRLYYSKSKNFISLLFAIFVFISIIALIFIGIDNNILVLFLIIFSLFVFFAGLDSFAKLFLKNPILILNKDQIYYLKTQKWYAIKDFQFEDRMKGRHNYSLTFCMFDSKKKIFSINNWDLKSSEDFKKYLKYNRLQIIKAKIY